MEIISREDVEKLADGIGRPSLIPMTKQERKLEDPARSYLSVKEKFQDSFLLESMNGGGEQSRYSIVGCNPLLHVKIKNGDVEITGNSELPKKSKEGLEGIDPEEQPLDVLRKAALMDEISIPDLDLPRYIFGITGYISYDFIRSEVNLANDTKDNLDHSLLEFTLPSLLIVFDHGEKITYYTSIIPLTEETSLDRSHSRSLEALERLIDTEPKNPEPANKDLNVTTNFPKEDFEEGVERVKEYIRDGHVIQTVISRRIDLEPSPDLEGFYLKLREINPSPYMFSLDFSGRTVLGSSPEALVRVEDGKVMTRPIAGTRRRGETEKEDAELERDLLEDEKERAEHVMLVDLGRNDIGKVSEFGSVETSEFMEIGKFGDVQHIVSTVEGELRDGADAFDALRSVFPAGTVTGAPKVRAMEIVEEVEPTRRGIYSGAVGTFSYTGNADFAISIRTLTASEGKAHIQVGGGIVADSVPEKEYRETQDKARSLLRAAGVEK